MRPSLIVVHLEDFSYNIAKGKRLIQLGMGEALDPSTVFNIAMRA